MGVLSMPSGCCARDKLRKRARVWHTRHAASANASARGLQRLARSERNVVLPALQRCDSDIQRRALNDRKLDIDAQASSRVHTAEIVPGQFAGQTAVPQTAT